MKTWIIAAACLALLLAKVSGEATGMHLVLDTELVVRAST